MNTTFSSLPLPTALLASLERLGYRDMTPIQQQALPVVLAGNDLIGQARTGSGKTATFALSLLAALNPRYLGCQALVLCPTRELAEQVAREIRQLASSLGNIKVLTLCGGTPFGPQVGSLEHGAHIVVGTPGRIQEHLRKETLRIHGLSQLVLDEADRMLDMGFIDAISEIIEQTPAKRQTLLFSATYPEGIEKLAERFLSNPQRIAVESLHDDSEIRQRFYRIDPLGRHEAVASLLLHHRPTSSVVFCATRQQCQELADWLNERKISSLALHGDLDQRERDQVLTLFASKACSVLVATDVAARGLDIDGLEVVINLELARDPQVHIHRIGRSGRAGEKGMAFSLVAPSEMYRAEAIEQLQQQELQWANISSVPDAADHRLLPPMTCICISAGRKEKMRAGDILGALTGEGGLPGTAIGKISLFDHCAYIAIERQHAREALNRLTERKVKGRSVRGRIL